MKTTISLVLTSVFLLSFQSGKVDKKKLFVGKWKEFGYKLHSDTEVKFVKEECSLKTMIFSDDWNYEERMYCLTSSGKWFFNEDRTKFGFSIDNFNGMKISNFIDTTKTNQIIIKLTSDTLIYGSEGYYGEKRVYGHDDFYFVRQQ